MGVAEKHRITCPNCGKSYALKPELAGKRVKCKCGGVMVVPVFDASDSPDDLYDMVPDAPPAAPSPQQQQRVQQQQSRQATINADEVLARLGKMPKKPPTAEQLAQQQREKDAANVALQESPLRDLYLPIVITAVGIVLAFVEAMSVGKHPAKTIAEAIPLVAMRISLGVGLVLLGMFLAAAAAEVCFIGSFKRQIPRFIAIAVGPAALWGLLQHWTGNEWGGAAGAFGTIAVYFALFYLMMCLDLQDSAICTIIVFIVIAFANYAAFRAEEMIKGSWI